MTLLDTTVLPFGLAWDSAGIQMASVDHAMWFHRPFRFDEWHLFTFITNSVSAGRGLSRGTVHARDGTLVASIAQEGLMRPREALVE